MNFKIGDIVYWRTTENNHWTIEKIKKDGSAHLILQKGGRFSVIGTKGAATSLANAIKVVPRGHPLTNIFKD